MKHSGMPAGICRWYILAMVLVFPGIILYGIALFAVAVTTGLKDAYRSNGSVVAGAWGACESMGEALVFLTAAIYWRKKQIWIQS